jgi:hypothetical protein
MTSVEHINNILMGRRYDEDLDEYINDEDSWGNVDHDAEEFWEAVKSGEFDGWPHIPNEESWEDLF